MNKSWRSLWIASNTTLTQKSCSFPAFCLCQQEFSSGLLLFSFCAKCRICWLHWGFLAHPHLWIQGVLCTSFLHLELVTGWNHTATTETTTQKQGSTSEPQLLLFFTWPVLKVLSYLIFIYTSYPPGFHGFKSLLIVRIYNHWSQWFYDTNLCFAEGI